MNNIKIIKKMLEEYMAFTGVKMPSPDEKLPVYKWNMKYNNKSKDKSLNTKFSKLSMESLDDIIEEEMTLAEKVLQRQLAEKQKLEEKKRKILKELHKKKKINVKKFLTREAGYEQKKIYNIEQKRFKELEEENKNFKDKPILSNKTKEICKNDKTKKKPIYLRTKEILENRQKNLENLNIKIKKDKKEENRLNKSMDEINNKEDNLYIVNNEIKNKKMTKKEMIDYYKKQNEWKNKLINERIKEDTIKNLKEEKEYRLYFQPKLSRGTQEIIMAMNEAKENYLYQTIESSNNNYYLTDTTYNPNYINYDDDVFKRLYENKKIERINKYSLFLQPITNKKKLKKIIPKYKEIDKNERNKKKSKVKKIKKRKERSLDIKYNNNKYIKNKINENKNKKEDNAYESWTNYLLKLKKNKSCEVSYHLNIRQSSAWNENDVNIVPYKGESREIIKNFL